jgi:transcription termination factor NusB
MIFNLRNSMRFLSIMLIALYGCQTIQSDNMSKAIDDTASQETSDSIREQDQHQLSMSDDPINDMTSVLESAKKNASVTRKGVAPPNNVIESLLSPLISSKITAPHESKFDINVKNVDAQSLFLGLVKDTSYG